MPEAALRATYRLQLTPSFTLFDAAQVVPYLARLGVSHVFCSPVLAATPGSTHGYDVVDHSRVNAELGGANGLAALHEAAEQHGLGVVLDIVPNHMAIGSPANRQWWDVLRRGSGSPFAGWFDIDWDAGGGRLLVPILAADLDTELAAGAIQIVDGHDGPEVAYYDHRLPLSPERANSPPADRQDLRALLDDQHYRLADWHESADQLNYRRFFDIDTLAGLRVEDPVVFAATHASPLSWVADGVVHGLRIDHPDGLRDPAEYLHRLRRATGGCWTVVEKILEPGEHLPPDWACDGTTGYDHMAMATGVFVDPQAEQPMVDGYAAFTGERRGYDEIVEQSKATVLADVLHADVLRVATLVQALSGATQLEACASAVTAIVAHFDVYRTYVVDGPPSPADAAIIRRAICAARADAPPALVDMIGAALLAEDTSAPAKELRARFQQLTGPAMAKSVEDTAFYRYVPLVSLNEVGGHPGHFGVDVATYHAHATHIAEHWPRSMNASTTHDTKRSEDVRARINLLAEMPAEWSAALQRWRELNVDAWHGTEPDPTMELLLYEVMVGAHPLPAERAVAYVVKAAKEAKRRTSWLAPDHAYEEALASFTREVATSHRFRAELDRFCQPLLVPGRMAALGQLVLKLIAPGVADIYQGCETWTDSLVDPDNRRPVDYDLRRALLHDCVTDRSPVMLLADDERGLTKLWLTRVLLELRARRADCFSGPTASYVPVAVAGDRPDTVVAAARGTDVVAVVGVRPLWLSQQVWADTAVELPPGRWRNLIERIPAAGEVLLAEHAGRYGATVFERES